MKLNVYYRLRSAMDTGDLLLWAGRDILAKIIQLWSYPSHASTIVRLTGLGRFRLFNYESLALGFRPHFLSHELRGCKGSVWWYKLKDQAQRAVIEDRIFRYDGTAYAFRTLFELPIERPDIETDQMVCSEAVEVVEGITKGKVLTPAELPSLGLWEPPIQIL